MLRFMGIGATGFVAGCTGGDGDGGDGGDGGGGGDGGDGNGGGDGGDGNGGGDGGSDTATPTDGSDGGDGDSTERVDQYFRWGSGSDPSSMDFNVYSTNYGQGPRMVSMAVIGQRAETHSEWVLYDAEDYEVSDGEFRLTLKDDLYWHQGGEVVDEVTAEDKVLQGRLGRAMTPQETRPENPLITGWRADGDKTVVFELRDEFNRAAVETQLIDLNDITHYRDSFYQGELEKIQDATTVEEKNTIRQNLVESKSVSHEEAYLSGPYMHESLGEGQWKLKVNPQHWAADGMNFAGLMVKAISSDALYQALVNDTFEGRVDNQVPGTVDESQVPDNVTVVSGPGALGDGLVINYDTEASDVDPILSKENLPEAALVRQGLAYAINKQRMKDVLLGGGPSVTGYGRATGVGEVMAKSVLSEEEYQQFPTYEQDLEKAAAKFREAGLSKQGGEWVKPNGEPLSLNITTFPWYTDSASLALQSLKNFGVNADQTTGEASTLTGAYWGSGDWEAAIAPFGSRNPPVSAAAARLAEPTANNAPPETMQVPPFGELDAEPTETVDLQAFADARRKNNDEELNIKDILWVNAYHCTSIPFVNRGPAATFNTASFEFPSMPDGHPFATISADEDPAYWSTGKSWWPHARGLSDVRARTE
jgi:peptide/nickel transport system substrate-binding protein